MFRLLTIAIFRLYMNPWKVVIQDLMRAVYSWDVGGTRSDTCHGGWGGVHNNRYPIFRLWFNLQSSYIRCVGCPFRVLGVGWVELDLVVSIVGTMTWGCYEWIIISCLCTYVQVGYYSNAKNMLQLYNICVECTLILLFLVGLMMAE